MNKLEIKISYKGKDETFTFDIDKLTSSWLDDMVIVTEEHLNKLKAEDFEEESSNA